MGNALIKVTLDGLSGDYRVDLHFEQGGAWTAAPIASTDLPNDLDVGDVPAVLPPGSIKDGISAFVRTNNQSPHFPVIGEYLGKLLLRGPVEQQWGQAVVERTLLQIEPDELRLLPWELMESDRTVRFLQPDYPFMRLRPLPAPRDVHDDVPHWLPIRVLVVEGERLDAIATLTEIHAIKAALGGSNGRIEAEFLTSPEPEELQDTCERFRPHIFHFIGHGETVPGGTESALRLRTWYLTETFIRSLLKPVPRVAILNACRSGQVGVPGRVEDVRALTDAFLERGAAAVVGMQDDIRGSAAALFGGRFYRSLAKGESIEVAVTEARKALYTATGYAKGERDWLLPSLTLRVPPQRVLVTTPEVTADLSSYIEQRFEALIGAFVNRTSERHRLVNRIDPDPDARPENLLLVIGDSDMGKTGLLHWLRRRCALRGRRVKYVDFKGGGNLDFLQALYAIRDRPEDMPNPNESVSSAFNRFNHDLTFFEQGKVPEETPERPPAIHPAPCPYKLGAGPVNLIDRVFQSFRDCLGEATADEPLVLILDHLKDLMETDFKQHLYPRLIRHVADGELPNVRLVIALSSQQTQDYWPREGGGLQVNVRFMEQDRFGSLAEDVLLSLGRSVCQQDKEVLSTVRGWLPANEPWTPRHLWLLAQMAAGKRG